MKPEKSKNIDVKQLKKDIGALSSTDFQAKYHVNITALKGLSDQELQERVSKILPKYGSGGILK